MKTILFIIGIFSGRLLMAQEKYERDTVAVQIAVQSIQERRDLLKEYAPPSTTDLNRYTVVLVNQKRIVSVDTILNIKPEDILSIKVINSTDSSLSVKKVILLDTK